MCHYYLTHYIYLNNWLSVVGLQLLYLVHCAHTHQCCVRCLLCRPNRPLPNPVYEYEYMDSGAGGAALANMTKNPSYMTAKEVVTSFTFGTDDDKEEDHTYEVLPFEANEEGQEDTTPGGQENAADGVHVYANQ